MEVGVRRGAHFQLRLTEDTTIQITKYETICFGSLSRTLLTVKDDLRRRFPRFKLCSHFLDLRILL